MVFTFFVQGSLLVILKPNVHLSIVEWAALSQCQAFCMAPRGDISETKGILRMIYGEMHSARAFFSMQLVGNLPETCWKYQRCARSRICSFNQIFQIYRLFARLLNSPWNSKDGWILRDCMDLMYTLHFVYSGSSFRGLPLSCMCIMLNFCWLCTEKKIFQ